MFDHLWLRILTVFETSIQQSRQLSCRGFYKFPIFGFQQRRAMARVWEYVSYCVIVSYARVSLGLGPLGTWLICNLPKNHEFLFRLKLIKRTNNSVCLSFCLVSIFIVVISDGLFPTEHIWHQNVGYTMMYFNRGFEKVGHTVQPQPEHRTKIHSL